MYTLYKLKCVCGLVNELRLPSEWINAAEPPEDDKVRLVWVTSLSTVLDACWDKDDECWMDDAGWIKGVTYYMDAPQGPKGERCQ